MSGALIHVFWAAIRIALLSWLGLAIVLFLRQRGMVFHPGPAIGFLPSQAGIPFEDVSFGTRDGEKLNGWFVPAPGAGATVLMCHGNGGNISDRVWALKRLHDAGFNAFIFDYRGYGRSTGRPNEAGLYLDARAAWDYLVAERGLPQAGIVIHGRSLGGAVACELASNVNAGALVLEAAFTSLPDLAAGIYPYLPVRALCRFRFNTLGRIARVRVPVLVAHSRDDDLIPFRHGERLYQAANAPKSFFVLRGDHNSGEAMDDSAWIDCLRGFIARHVTGAGPSAGE
ncbi:MAG: alpha/beta hydrolase [Lentisphaerae bacterium]|nr:alpha/beta hydrolase [Lentisphaerota bacterium]